MMDDTTTDGLIGCDRCGKTVRIDKAKLCNPPPDSDEAPFVSCGCDAHKCTEHADCDEQSSELWQCGQQIPTAGPLVDDDPVTTVCRMFNEIVAKRTPLPRVLPARLTILCRDLIESHWRRHEQDHETFRTVMERLAESEGLWSCKGIGFARLWQSASKYNCTWFDAIEQDMFRSFWWLDPYHGKPLPTIAIILGRKPFTTLRHGVDVSGLTGDVTCFAERYCDELRRVAPHLVREYEANITANLESARGDGIPDDSIRSGFETKWEHNQNHGGMLMPLVDALMGTA